MHDHHGRRVAWILVGLALAAWGLVPMAISSSWLELWGWLTLAQVVMAVVLAVCTLVASIHQLGRPGRPVLVLSLALVSSLILQLATLVVSLAVVEFMFQDAMWIGCSGATLVMALSIPTRGLACCVAAGLWLGALTLIARPTRWWRLAAIPMVGVSAWLLATNYLAVAWDCDNHVVADALEVVMGGELRVDAQARHDGPVDATRVGLPLSEEHGKFTCKATFGRRLVLYRIGASPVEVYAPLLRAWPNYSDAVASVFMQADGSQRVVWLCGQDAPAELFERLAAERAAEHQLRVDSVAAIHTEPGTTRYEAWLR